MNILSLFLVLNASRAYVFGRVAQRNRTNSVYIYMNNYVHTHMKRKCIIRNWFM